MYSGLVSGSRAPETRSGIVHRCIRRLGCAFRDGQAGVALLLRARRPQIRAISTSSLSHLESTLMTPLKSVHSKQLTACRIPPQLPQNQSLCGILVTVANTRVITPANTTLTEISFVTPLYATLTKKMGRGGPALGGVCTLWNSQSWLCFLPDCTERGTARIGYSTGRHPRTSARRRRSAAPVPIAAGLFRWRRGTFCRRGISWQRWGNLCGKERPTS